MGEIAIARLTSALRFHLCSLFHQTALEQALEQALDAVAPSIPLFVVKCGPRGALLERGSQRG
jgi:hypothetical protein